MKAKAVMHSPFFLSQQHQTSNPKHQTSNIKLQTPNSKLQTSNFKLYSPLTRSEGGRIIYAYLVI